ncbi:MAG: corrinoid protein [Lachnospiraceae bacterium]|nr:corrinoid protein [Lachnospiraceae bacterium]
MATIFEQLADAVVEMEDEEVKALSEQAIKDGVDAFEAIDQGLTKGMERAGVLFEEEEYFVPELLSCADAMNEALLVFSPYIKKEQYQTEGKIVIGSVQGDTHDIGKNIVGLFLESAGFEVYNLGRDVAPEIFVEEALKKEADIMILSTLMTTTMSSMKDVIDLLVEKGLRDRFLVMVGGRPLSIQFAKDIGADGYSADAKGAVRMARKLMQQKKEK